MGEMAELYDYFYDWPEDLEEDDWRVRCKFCRKREFKWKQIPGVGWRLHTVEGKLHTCRKAREYYGSK